VTQTTRWALLAAIPLAAVAIVAAVLLTRSTTAAAPPPPTVDESIVTWPARAQAAPAIDLLAADGAPLTLASLRGKPTIVTFVDPHCTTFCPAESHVIDKALKTMPAPDRPHVLAVSVDPTVRAEAELRKQARRFEWLPQWQWATGGEADLARVWRAYHIVVIPTKDEINHTEAAYVVDADGYQRALLVWPFDERDVKSALATAESG
jgi:cytochrome oxidase Cu insertion factor (SCO1/SenC/PrrC family)